MLAALVVVAAAAAVMIGGASATRTRAASAQVCVLLPDTKSSVRWTAVRRAGPRGGVQEGRRHAPSILNAQGSATTQNSQAEQCLTNGAKVILLVRARLGLAVRRSRQRRQGGREGRSTTTASSSSGKASYYVSFDNVQVGKLQGQGLVAALKANGTYGKKPVVAELNGGTTDNNAKLFKQGYDSVLNPLYKSGHVQEGPEPVRARTGTTRSRA